MSGCERSLWNCWSCLCHQLCFNMLPGFFTDVFNSGRWFGLPGWHCRDMSMFSPLVSCQWPGVLPAAWPKISSRAGNVCFLQICKCCCPRCWLESVYLFVSPPKNLFWLPVSQPWTAGGDSPVCLYPVELWDRIPIFLLSRLLVISSNYSGRGLT